LPAFGIEPPHVGESRQAAAGTSRDQAKQWDKLAVVDHYRVTSVKVV
jgi:hypothetical protein